MVLMGVIYDYAKRLIVFIMTNISDERADCFRRGCRDSDSNDFCLATEEVNVL